MNLIQADANTTKKEALPPAIKAAGKKSAVRDAIESSPITTDKALVPEQALAYMKKEKIDAWISYQYSDEVKNEAMTNIFSVPERLTTGTVSVLFADGRALLFVAKLEANKFEQNQAEVIPYANPKEFEELFRERLKGCKKIAMDCSTAPEDVLKPGVPANLYEFMKKEMAKVKVVSSLGVIQNAAVPVSAEAVEEHRIAASKLHQIIVECFDEIRKGIKDGKPVTEFELQSYIMRRYDELGMATCHNRPIVAVNEHTVIAHYEAPEEGSAKIRKGDVVLIDVWAKNKKPHAAYSDMTWMAFVGKKEDIPERYAKAFKVQTEAVQKVLDYINGEMKAGKPLIPWEIDKVARSWIVQHGYPEYPHGTGHNMVTQNVHGPGVRLWKNIAQPLALRSLYTVEPGIYNESFGARTELDIYLDPEKGAVITTRAQNEIACLY